MIPKASTQKARSYDFRVKRGDRVTFVATAPTMIHSDTETDPSERPRCLVVGAHYSGTALGSDNAGFRGIEMSVRLDIGGTVHSVSTGIIIAFERPSR